MTPSPTAVNSTAPKPFVFVLMPFEGFNDIYAFGIQGAAEDAGAYAERVDDQLFTGGILDRIFNQINKADVIVADMTGRNANVFYEVGYAHALGKVVLLVTQLVEDIPFDLKHRPHLVYGGDISKLKSDLTPRIRWAIAESNKQGSFSGEDRLIVSSFGLVLGGSEAQELSIPLSSVGEAFFLSFDITNGAPKTFPGSSHMYILSRVGADMEPCELQVDFVRPRPFLVPPIEVQFYSTSETVRQTTYPSLHAIFLPEDDKLIQYRLPASLPSLPPGAVEQIDVWIKPGTHSAISEVFTLRIHTPQGYHDYSFRVTLIDDRPAQALSSPPAKPQ